MRRPVEVNRIVYNALGAVKILLLVRCRPLRKSFPGPVLLLYYPVISDCVSEQGNKITAVRPSVRLFTLSFESTDL